MIRENSKNFLDSSLSLLMGEGQSEGDTFIVVPPLTNSLPRWGERIKSVFGRMVRVKAGMIKVRGWPEIVATHSIPMKIRIQ